MKTLTLRALNAHMTKFRVGPLTASRRKLTQKDAARVVSFLFYSLRYAMTVGKMNRISIPDFGVFKVRKRKKRKAIDIHSGEWMELPATWTVAFTPAKSLRELLGSSRRG